MLTPHQDIEIRDFLAQDIEQILQLNQEFVRYLSPLTSQRLIELSKICAMLNVAESAGRIQGFILTFTEDISYNSENYQWFCQHYKQFLYIDRIVISQEAQGLGIAGKFYQKAREWAAKRSLDKLVAEIDIEPPNPVSLTFHKKQGFREVGQQQLNSGKVVSLQCSELK